MFLCTYRWILQLDQSLSVQECQATGQAPASRLAGGCLPATVLRQLGGEAELPNSRPRCRCAPCCYSGDLAPRTLSWRGRRTALANPSNPRASADTSLMTARRRRLALLSLLAVCIGCVPGLPAAARPDAAVAAAAAGPLVRLVGRFSPGDSGAGATLPQASSCIPLHALPMTAGLRHHSAANANARLHAACRCRPTAALPLPCGR